MHATKFTALLDPRNKPSRCTRKRAILTASASVILLADVTRRQRPPSDENKKNGGASPESIIDHRKRELNVLRDAIDPDALDDGIDLMSPPGTFALFGVVHDSVLDLRIVYKAVSVTNTELDQPLQVDYLVVKPTAFRIRKHHENVIRH